jgi:hypothetical protein
MTDSAANPRTVPTATQFPYRVVDSRNQGWLHQPSIGPGMYDGFDPTYSAPRPLTDAQLAALGTEPGQDPLTVEQVARIVTCLPVRSGPRADDPASALRALAERLNIPGATESRLRRIVERINTETSDEHGYNRPRFNIERQLLDPRPLEEIERHFGPTRPVLPLLTSDGDDLRAALAAAGRKAICCVASALETVWFEARERFGPWNRDPGATADYAKRTLIAGRPGSWESAGIERVVWFGNELNLYPHKQSLPVETMRATGPNLKRVDVEVRDRIAAVLRRWTASPDRYTEVAENLKAEIGEFADATYGADGWAKIADQWLQPGGLAKVNFASCYHLLYSGSAHFDSGL